MVYDGGGENNDEGGINAQQFIRLATGGKSRVTKFTRESTKQVKPICSV
jgi:hypothetical protein